MLMRDPVPVEHKFTIGDRVVLNQLIASHDKYNHRLLNYFGHEGKINTIHYNDKKLLYYTVEFQTDNMFVDFALEDIPEEWLLPKSENAKKVVCIFTAKCHDSCKNFTVGKVYTVNDDVIMDDHGTFRSFKALFYDGFEFIEFKGE